MVTKKSNKIITETKQFAVLTNRNNLKIELLFFNVLSNDICNRIIIFSN